MNLSAIQVIIALLGTGTCTAVVTSLFLRRRNNSEADKFTAEAAKVIADAATSMIHERGAMAAESEERLEARIRELEMRILHLSHVVQALTEQLESEGLQPAIPPMPNGGAVI